MCLFYRFDFFFVRAKLLVHNLWLELIMIFFIMKIQCLSMTVLIYCVVQFNKLLILTAKNIIITFIFEIFEDRARHVSQRSDEQFRK